MCAAGSREATPYDAPSNKQNPAFNPTRLKNPRCIRKKTCVLGNEEKIQITLEVTHNQKANAAPESCSEHGRLPIPVEVSVCCKIEGGSPNGIERRAESKTWRTGS